MFPFSKPPRYPSWQRFSTLQYGMSGSTRRAKRQLNSTIVRLLPSDTLIVARRVRKQFAAQGRQMRTFP